MKHRMAVAAIAVAALIIGACADQDGGASRLSTEPGGESGGADARITYVTTGVASVMDSRTHQLRIVKPSAATAPGVSASVTAGGTGSVLQIPIGSLGLAKTSGYYTVSFTDMSLHRHKVVLLYPLYGGPPTAMQHYVDGALATVTSYSWKKTTTGWLRMSSLLRVVRSGALVGTYSTTTTATNTGTGPAIPVRLEHQGAGDELQHMLNSVAYGFAFALAPQDASAQVVSPAISACMQEWLKYAAAAAVIVGIEVLIAEAPVLTPFLVAQFATASALLAAAEDALLGCMLGNQPGTFQYFGGGGGAGTGGTGSAGDSDCLEGSYAAHCTTPFTL